MNLVFLSIGSNLGKKEVNLTSAVKNLDHLPETRITAKSSLYRTDPVGYREQDCFLNAVLRLETNLTARELLKQIHDIENHLGRKRVIRWGPRTIDIDILLFNQEIIREPDLIVPHPEMHKRRFVLVPLTEIDATVQVPNLGTAGGLLAKCKPVDEVLLVKSRYRW